MRLFALATLNFIGPNDTRNAINPPPFTNKTLKQFTRGWSEEGINHLSTVCECKRFDYNCNVM